MIILGVMRTEPGDLLGFSWILKILTISFGRNSIGSCRSWGSYGKVGKLNELVASHFYSLEDVFKVVSKRAGYVRIASRPAACGISIGHHSLELGELFIVSI